MRPQVVQFSSHPHPFRISVDQCANPDCPCADVTFSFQEIVENGSQAATPMAFGCRVNPQDWKEIDTAAKRESQVATIVAEFLRDYPVPERLRLAERARQKQLQVKRLSEYCLKLSPNEIAGGTLVAFSEIASEKGSFIKGGSALAYRLKSEDREFFIEDCYCPNPDCHCNAVHLRFFEYKPGAAQNGADLLTEAFEAKVVLGGKARVEDYFDWPREDADKLTAAWWDEFHGDVPQLEWRYGKVKEIARRTLRLATVSMPRPSSARNRPARAQLFDDAARPGRNDPCPCGSGKKFKRCCGP